MFNGFKFQFVPASVSEHPHPWLKLQHNIMTEHYKAFKSFVMSASTLTSMLEKKHTQRFIINGRTKPSKKYLVCPTKALPLLSRNDEEANSDPETIISIAPLPIPACGLSNQQRTREETFYSSDVCSEENVSLFEEDKNNGRPFSKQQTIFPISPIQGSVVTSSEETATELNNSNDDDSDVIKLKSDVMWSYYGNEAAVTSSVLFEEAGHHSPPECSMISKYMSETPPQNSRLHDFTQQDINILNKRFLPSQIQTPCPTQHALDLSRPKSKSPHTQDENIKPQKRRRVYKGKTKLKKESEEQTAALDFSLKTRAILRKECKTLTSTNMTQTDDRQNGFIKTEKSLGTDDRSVIGLTASTDGIRHTEKKIGVEGVRHRKMSVRGVIPNKENRIKADGICLSDSTGNRVQIHAKKSVLVERVQLENLVKLYVAETVKLPTIPSVASSSHAVNGKAKTHACSYCGKMFAQKSSVHTHERTHTGVRPYRCEYCGRDFIDCSTYTKHVRLHTGERPYSCDICGRGFSQSGNMLRHKAARHPEGKQVTSVSKKMKTRLGQ